MIAAGTPKRNVVFTEDPDLVDRAEAESSSVFTPRRSSRKSIQTTSAIIQATVEDSSPETHTPRVSRSRRSTIRVSPPSTPKTRHPPTTPKSAMKTPTSTAR